MINKISFNPIVFRNNQAKGSSVTNPNNTQHDVKTDFYIDKKGAEAIKNYNSLTPVKQSLTDISEPISFEDYKNRLIKSGLKENIDFYAQSNSDIAMVFISEDMNSSSIKKFVYWEGGIGKENFGGFWDKNDSKSEVKEMKLAFDEAGVPTDLHTVYKDAEKVKMFFPQDIDINTTVNDYTSILDKKGIKYEIDDHSTDNSTLVIIDEYDKNNNINKTTFFKEASWYKSIGQMNEPNSDGKYTHAVELVKTDNSYKLEISENIKENIKVKNSR